MLPFGGGGRFAVVDDDVVDDDVINRLRNFEITCMLDSGADEEEEDAGV